MSLKRTHNAFESDSGSARFDCYPYAGPNFVQAVEHTLVDIEERGAVCCIRGADMGRYRPLHAVLCLFHFKLRTDIHIDNQSRTNEIRTVSIKKLLRGHRYRGWAENCPMAHSRQ